MSPTPTTTSSSRVSPRPPRFSKDTLQFIRKAARAKRPDWLERHRSEYEKALLEPLQNLARHLKATLGPHANGYNFPQKGLARLKRSADRAREYGAPFKDWVSYSAARPRKSRFDHNPNLFFLINPDDPDGETVLVAGGLYMPSSRQMRSLREAIAKDASAFDRLFADKAFAACFPGGFSDERKSSRPPRGFDPNHPRIEWLKLQAFFVWKPYTQREFTSPVFPETVARDGAQILRLNQLLEQALENRLPAAPATASARTRARPASLGSRLEELDGLQAPRRKMDF
jgi:uncharacterized protein (TIGR02453 family)